MLKYSKIMCAFEFDGNSIAALLLSGTLAKESNATLYILHIARVPTQDMDVPLPFDSHPRWEEEARSRLAEIVKKTLKPEVQCVIEVRTGVPDLDIVRAARDLAVDLIVMVTHGRTGLEHFVLGSFTEHVIHASAVASLVSHGIYQALSFGTHIACSISDHETARSASSLLTTRSTRMPCMLQSSVRMGSHPPKWSR